MSEQSDVEQWLREWVLRHGGVAGTVHERREDELVLRAALNIPPHVLQVVRTVPKGKGMAGLAFERAEPISTCNLKTDQSGNVRPGAKAVDANAAVAIPVHDRDGQVRAVVGIAYMGERDLPDAELARLREEAEAVPL